MSTPLVVVGDTLLDRDLGGDVHRVAPDAPVPVVDQSFTRSRPGGAGLAALLAARHGRTTTLVTALGDDEAGAEVAELLSEEGVRLIDLGTSAATPEKIRIQGQGRPLVRLDRGGSEPGTLGPLPADAAELIGAAKAILVSDYGRGVTGHAEIRREVGRITRATPVVWDPHPRGRAPVIGCRLVTPNGTEAARFAAAIDPLTSGSRSEIGRVLLEAWAVGGVVITLGDGGALLVDGGAHSLHVPAPKVRPSDTCGAGDMFAVAVVGLLADGLVPSEAVEGAVRAAASFVEAGGAAAIGPPGQGPLTEHAALSAADLAAEVRRRGGTVVATGGCFDVIHRGHIEMLQAAAELGDCLIVCLNGDASVRRLKGPERPVNPCGDRVAVLEALACVNAVEVFEESTPNAALARIQPHLWVKGGDYRAARLPEASLVESWGGEVVILPYLRGRSTTDIVSRVGARD